VTADDRLLSHVRPPDWRNPSPQPLYDLAVIGGGTAGLVCAAGAAGVGARVALIERSRLGGDCLNTGCVPSKALLRSARVVGEARAGETVGVLAVTHPDFTAVMRRLRERRADIAPHDSAGRLRDLGVDVFFGHAAFRDAETISVRANDPNGPDDPNLLRFRKAVIATGSRPAIPPIPGMDAVPLLTSETVFDLSHQPRSLAVLGGGPVGCELAQAFARLGTHVTVIESSPQLLPREDFDAAAIVARALSDDGVEVMTRVEVQAAAQAGAGVALTHAGGRIDADALLVATGRVSTVADLHLEAAGILSTPEGIVVDDRLRTANRRVYVAGDAASRYRFTHAADALARIVVRNALFFGRQAASRLVIPWCTFTSPEVAHVGVTSLEADKRGIATITIPLSEVDRAVIDDETAGFVRVHHRRGRILGATVVAHGAGELIGTITAAVQAGLTLGQLSAVVFPYPTLSTALRQAADAFQRTRLTPVARRVLEYYFRRSG
jgi:pyruvate/2-oxoglutarate dehydrogenase complex dihydrolipoamide dehydrogenase (E3) component